jgi:aryl-alcohol dehydrogenase-like predicted oxidoreductase
VIAYARTWPAGIAAPEETFCTDMSLRKLGPSDLEISRVGVGTAPIGSRPGEWWVNWGHQDDGDSVRAIHAAIDEGVNWVDTAPFYGWGHAEEIVGRAVDGRDGVLVFTKCGTERRDDGDDYMDLTPAAIRRGCDESLRRLRRERLDLLQFHDVDRAVPIEESWGALHELIAEGKVRYGGLSNHPPELVERALAIGPVAALQFEYSAIARREEERLLPLAGEHGLGVIVWAPLASGFLTDGFSVHELATDDFRRTHPFAELDLAETHSELRRRGAGSVTRGALEFVLAHPDVTGAIVGIRNEGEARDLAELV